MADIYQITNVVNNIYGFKSKNSSCSKKLGRNLECKKLDKVSKNIDDYTFLIEENNFLINPSDNF
jgi:hypothetical protein